MKLLVYKWGNLMIRELLYSMKEMKVPFEVFSGRINFDKKEEKTEMQEELSGKIRAGGFDAVFSINFCSPVAAVCQREGLPYIIWSFDSPAVAGLRDDIFSENNYFFLFDSREVEIWKRRELPHVSYLPLAVNTRRLDRITTPYQLQQKYRSEISFVGQLYETEIADVMRSMSGYIRGYLQSLIDIQLQLYNVNLFDELITDNFLQNYLTEEAKEKMKEFARKRQGITLEDIGEGRMRLFLNRAVTSKERVMLLALLAKRYQVKLYSYGKHQALKNVNFCGTVDSYTDMPRVFRFSKINLNVTLRSIQAGIPLRCLDIMGTGGFLLSNYQRDFERHFENGRDMVWYESLEEAVEKADFYLKHEDLRKKIAHNGYCIVKEYFNFERQLNKMLEICGLKNKKTGGLL